MQSKTSVRSFSRVLVTLAWTLALVGAVAAPSYAEGGAQKPPAAERVTGPVNVNTASAAELIIEYRQKNGGFKKLEDLMNVRGIGEKTFLKLKPMLTLTPPKATLL